MAWHKGKRPDHFKALGHLEPGEMNKTEEAYSQLLEAMRLDGEILWYQFDVLKLRLADGTFYSPDFLVLTKDNLLECHEVKGFWTDDARVKIKVAAQLFPFKFMAVKKQSKREGGGWTVENF